jgi:hypothetical protein
MEASQDLPRQVRLLTQSRNRWKDKAANKQGQILYLRVKVRDLEASRDAWKQRALAAELSHPTASLQSPSATLPKPVCVIVTQESDSGES